MHAKPSPVINSSPLIALVAALPDFGVLGHLVSKLIVPAEVLAELDAGGKKDDTAEIMRRAPFYEPREARASQLNPLTMSLGKGEAAVIQTALDENHPLVVIDEVRGRRAARLAGLTVIGSLGILVELKRASLITDVGGCIKSMKAKGIHLSASIIRQTLVIAGEQT